MMELEETIACRICGYREGLNFYEVCEQFYGTGQSFSYFECPNCGCLQIVKFPKDIATYYRDYYSMRETGTAPAAPARWRAAANRMLLLDRGPLGRTVAGAICTWMPDFWLVDLIRLVRRLGISEFSESILDVGCGAGSLLNVLRGLGFTQLFGCDPYLDRPVASEAITIWNCDIAAIEEGRTFKFVTLMHTFEHLADPRGVLDAIEQRLEPGGRVYVEIPVADSYAWRHYQEHWVDHDAPRHFFLHTQKSMSILLDGSRLVCHAVYPVSSPFEFFGSEQYLKGISLESERSFLKGFENSIFSTDDIRRLKKLSREKDVVGEAGRCVFVLGR